MTIDRDRLKALAEAANAVTTDVNITMAVGSDPEEVKAVQGYLQVAMPKTILALLVEIERLELENKQITYSRDTKEEIIQDYICSQKSLVMEREQLKAQNALAEEARDLYFSDKKRLAFELNDALELVARMRKAALCGAEYLAKARDQHSPVYGSVYPTLSVMIMQDAGYSSEQARCQLAAWLTESNFKKEPNSGLGNG